MLEDGVSKLDSLEAAFCGCFTYPSLSAASADFGAMDVSAVSNEKVSKAVSTTLDAIASMAEDGRILETFLHLHIPKMEDGNNFGVSVQLASLKQLSELAEASTKGIDELSGYANARAEALDKLKLPSASISVTKSTSLTTTDGKLEDKKMESKEEKSTTNESAGIGYNSRVAALVAVDTLYYSKAERAFHSVMTMYMACLDFMDKNKDKIEKPKGRDT